MKHPVRRIMLIIVPLLVLANGAQAQLAVPSKAEPPLAVDLLDRCSRGVFEFNRLVYQGMEQLPDRLDLPSGGAFSAVGAGLANAVSNLTNEPITAAASLLTGD